VNQTSKVIVGQMSSREKQIWKPEKQTKKLQKRLLRGTGIFAAVSLCMGMGAYVLTKNSHDSQSVMSHLTAGFEYDESLGRLQFVSNVLPQSAMVFLSGDSEIEMLQPVSAQETHVWTNEEPWIEYACSGSVSACDSGEVITVVKNRQNEYTVRVLHDNGYESVYSGLNAVSIKEFDEIIAGQQIGTSDGRAAFELRKKGLSVLPVFADL